MARHPSDKTQFNQQRVFDLWNDTTMIEEGDPQPFDGRYGFRRSSNCLTGGAKGGDDNSCSSCRRRLIGVVELEPDVKTPPSITKQPR